MIKSFREPPPPLHLRKIWKNIIFNEIFVCINKEKSFKILKIFEHPLPLHFLSDLRWNSSVIFEESNE